MKYLEFYTKVISDGALPLNGLCASFKNDPLFSLIDPEFGKGETYWGFDCDDSIDAHQSKMMNPHWFMFTPLRQNIVLLMAAMNNEL